MNIRRLFSLCLLTLTAVTAWAQTVSISTAEKLADLASAVNEGVTFQGKTIELTADIDLSAHVWVPIGNDGSSNQRFAGTFDGKGKTIRGLSVNKSGSDYAGLFGFLDGATVQDLTIEGAYVVGKSGVGVLAGYGQNCTITNCHVTGTTTISGTEYVSGLVGRVEGLGTTISSNCSVATSNTCTLANDGDNSTALSSANGQLNVTLSGRTLYRDGKWNTICLPFDLVIAGSELDGAGVQARSLTSASISGEKVLNLTFSASTPTLLAGVPYIIKWDSDAENIVSPVLKGVVVRKTAADADAFTSDDEKVSFKGTFNKIDKTASDNNILFMGGESNLYYPNGATTIGACRAYFEINEVGLSRFTTFNLTFEDETSGIDELNVQNSEFIIHNSSTSEAAKPSADAVYDLQGRSMINGQWSMKKGLYIKRSAGGRLQGKNGKKYVK